MCDDFDSRETGNDDVAITERRAAAPTETTTTPTTTRGERPSSPASRDAARPAPRGFRPGSRRRTRIAIGVVLAAVAIGGNVALYTSLDDSDEVLQLVRNVRAGEQVTPADLRVVEADLEPTVPVVVAGDIASVVGQYARVYIASGSLMVEQLVQPEPLVTPGTAVVAIEVSPTGVPEGLRERSKVTLVVSADVTGESAVTVDGRVVARGDDADEISGRFPLSVEVAEPDAPLVAAADDVRLVLVDPEIDPAADRGADG